MSNRRQILAAASILLIGNLASRLLGLVRDQVIAAFFSISAETSAFWTANAVPQMFYDLLIGGAVSAALVPVLSDYVEPSDREEFGRVVGTLLVGAAMLLVVAVVLLMLAAVPLAQVLGAAKTPAMFPIALSFVRIVTPALLFLGLSGVTGAVCYARRWFTYPAFSLALYNLGLIATVFALHDRLGPYTMVYGLLVGAFLQFVAVSPGLRGIPIRLGFEPNHPAVRRILTLYAPVAAGLIVTEVSVVIDRNLANGIGPSSVAIMAYATRLIQLPLGLVATATSLAVLPILSRLADDLPAFRQTLSMGLRLALLAIVPATVFLVVFPGPVFHVLFERGAFDATATTVTARAFLLYAPQLPFVAVDQLLVYAFYARKNTLTPMLVGLGGVVVYLVSALTLIGPFQLGLGGLIIANTLQNSLHAVVLFVLLSRSVGQLRGTGVGVTLGRLIVAGIAAAAIAIALRVLIPAPTSTLHLALYLVAVASLVGIVYLGLLHIFGVEEVNAIPRMIRSRLIAPPPQPTRSA